MGLTSIVPAFAVAALPIACVSDTAHDDSVGTSVTERS